MSGSIFGGAGVSSAQVGAMLHPGLQAGSQVLSIPFFNYGSNNAAIAADTRYTHPVYVPQSCVCTGVQIVVGTAVASVSGKLSLYRGGPGRSVADLLGVGTAPVDMNAASNTVLQADFSAGVPLTTGWYYPVCKFDGAAQPFTAPTGAGGLISACYWFGAPALTSWVRAASNGYTRMTSAEAYASNFSDPFGAVTFSAGVPGSPIMGLVVTV